MSQQEMRIRKVPDEATPEIEVIEEAITCQHEDRTEMPETSTGTKTITVLFRGITNKLRNQLLHGVTRQEVQWSLLDSNQVHHVSDSPLYIKESDLSKKMYDLQEGRTRKDASSLLRDSHIWNKEKRPFNGHLNPRRDLGDGLLPKTRDRHIQAIPSHIDGEIYQRSALYLDVNTAGNNVVVKGDLKAAFWTVEDQCYPKTRKRFQGPQVLSMNSFQSGQHYWVVETSKSGNWRIGMSYPSIARKGFRSYVGCSDKSWGLCKWNNEYSVMHNCKEVHLSSGLSTQKLAIFLDYKAGQLSFYELGNSARLLHTFTANFTEPLHAVFRIWLDSLGSSWIYIKD